MLIAIFGTLAESRPLYSEIGNFTEAESYLRMMTMSDHNEIFVVGGDDHKVHIYVNEGDNFVNHDSLLHSSNHVDVAEITGDGKWMLAIDESGFAFIYKFNLKTHEFSLHQWYSLSSSDIYAGTITDDHMWMAFGSSIG